MAALFLAFRFQLRCHFVREVMALPFTHLIPVVASLHITLSVAFMALIIGYNDLVDLAAPLFLPY